MWLVEAADVFAKLIYAVCNPVAAHLVDRANQWPGATSLPAMLTGKEVVVRRPHWFFDREGDMPEHVRYRFKRPRAFASPATHAPRRAMSPRVAAHNKWSRTEALQRNKHFLEDYRAALEIYRQGDTDVIFPPGTHQLHQDGHVYRQAA